MNLIVNKLGSLLHNDSVSDLLMAKLNGLPLELFQQEHMTGCWYFSRKTLCHIKVHRHLFSGGCKEIGLCKMSL
jgi:hypothetical protein